MSWQETVIIGIISGVISSICFSLILLLIKPCVKISKEMCKEKIGANKYVYRVKIVNHTWAMLTNIKYTLHYSEMHGDGISTITEIQPRKSQLMCIEGYTLSKNDTDYAVRLSYDIDQDKYPLNENTKLIFTFIADHSLSNTTTSIKKEYYAEDIIAGVFESDKSTKIIREHSSQVDR